MVHDHAEIGRFLKAHRSALSPDRVGLPEGHNRRRVRGLRREEVAQLAGVSVDYYTRIEQGRSGAVSHEVLDALSDALHLTRVERDYLQNLARRFARRSGGAGRAAGPANGPCAPPDLPPERVRGPVRALIDAMDDVPALVLGGGLNLLAWNRMAGRLMPILDEIAEPHPNMARLLFLHPDVAALHLDLDEMRREVAAKLRADTGRRPDDQRLCRVVTGLKAESPLFRDMWEAQEVRERMNGECRLRHPVVGDLSLHFEKMLMPADPGQMLVTYVAEPGSPAESALRLLAGAEETV
ncbi:helix-turn-helix transcriptional regulator [Nocardiopsis rhodophaea]|uniref:Helix-turn-helix transcriptional regulator n=1 Tax=Nocardiopsis rhodophaea TaxID=280238 RepID=A0ABN2T4Q4_9ACTN